MDQKTGSTGDTRQAVKDVKHKHLETFLEEVEHCLPLKDDTAEILNKIRADILEKAASLPGDPLDKTNGENTKGNIDEKIGEIITGYGSPWETAEKYLQDLQLISPAFKKHIPRYTGFVFAIHYGLTILFFLLGTNFRVLPFIFFPKLENGLDLMSMAPVVFLYDLGLVGIVFYLVTQQEKSIRIPWPVFRFKWMKEKKGPPPLHPPKPKIAGLVFLVLGFGILVYLFVRFGTFFVATLTLESGASVKPLFTPLASSIYSIAVLFSFGLELACYIIRFFRNSYYVYLVRACFYFVICWTLLNTPLKSNLVIDLPFFDIETIVQFSIILVIIMVTVDLISTILKLSRIARLKRREPDYPG